MITCPKCRIETESKHERGVFYDLCPNCEGLWLSRDMYERLEHSPDFRPRDKLAFAFEVLEEWSLNCPGCGSKMAHGTIGEIVIDICPDCIGIWFDQGEFEDIFRFDPKTGSYTVFEKVMKYVLWSLA